MTQENNTTSDAEQTMENEIKGLEEKAADSENQGSEKVMSTQELEKAITKEQETINALSDEVTRYKEQLLRFAADMDNQRKRAARDIEESAKYAISKFARDLLDVLENLYRAEASINIEELESNNTLKQIFSGVELTKKSLIDAFEKNGIRRIDPIGEQFNHDFHQAITQIPSTTHQNGAIVQVIQAGYMLNNRLLRPALVAVSKTEENLK